MFYIQNSLHFDLHYVTACVIWSCVKNMSSILFCHTNDSGVSFMICGTTLCLCCVHNNEMQYLLMRKMKM